MGARLSPGQLSSEVEIHEADKWVARSLGNGAVDCTAGGRRSCLRRVHPKLQAWTLHHALSLSSECPVARGHTPLGADACRSGGCSASPGGCSHIEAQSG